MCPQRAFATKAPRAGSGTGFGSRKTKASASTDAPESTPKVEINAYSLALRMLGAREQSTQQLKTKLLSKGASADAIVQAVDRLSADGYLSDQRFAQSATRSLSSRGKGPRAIQQKMHQAGISPGLSKQSLIDLDIDWLSKARELLERKFGEDAPIDKNAWAKRARFLIARGFTEDIVRKALR
jgi:regulatory protein